MAFMSNICFDKTGVLTINKLGVLNVIITEGDEFQSYEVEGNSLSYKGKIKGLDNQMFKERKNLLKFVHALCATDQAFTIPADQVGAQ